MPPRDPSGRSVSSVPIPDQQTLLTGTLAGHYAIEGEPGAGGMATVYLAHDTKHDCRVATTDVHGQCEASVPGSVSKALGMSSFEDKLPHSAHRIEVFPWA